MASLNKSLLIGNLGADPEVRYTQSGDCVATIKLATSDSWTDKASGEKREKTEWHRVVFYRKLAEIVGQHLKKGASCYVEGKLVTKKWTDKDGVDRYTTQIDATEMKMLSSRKESQISGAQTSSDVDDDIPF